MCLAGATAVGYVYWKLGKLVHFEDLVVDEVAESEEPRNYLLVGSDSRDNIDRDDPDYDAFLGDEGGDGKRSDTIIIVRIDPEIGTVDMLSFPRDLWLPIADTGGRDRINTAYGKGRQVLIDTIRENFGIAVNHYVEVDFRGFQGLVGAIGGVPMYFDSALRDDSSGLFIDEPGCVTLDGDQALAFARSRSLEFRDEDGDWRTDPTADLGRITRQQIFLQRALDRALSPGFTDPVRLNRLLDVAIDSVGVDAGLDAGDLLNLARQFEEFSGEELETHTLPVTPSRTAGGASVLELDERAAQPTLNIFRGLPPGAVAETEVAVTVLNGTGAPRQAADASAALEAVGFVADQPSDAPAYARTTIRYAPGSEYAADLLRRHLSAGARYEVDEDLDVNEVVLVTGENFTTVTEDAGPPGPLPETPPTTTTTASTNGSSGTTSTTGSGGDTDDEDGSGVEDPTGADDGDDDDADADGTTTTTIVGITPGEPPPGVDCG